MKLYSILESPESVLDVIFIHGLMGNYRTTWQFDTGLWLEGLRSSFKNTNVWSLDYDAAAFRHLGTPKALPDVANDLLSHLLGKGIGQRKLCFIAHSLGGLLVKQLLRNSNDTGDRFALIAEKTEGVVFLGTPHNGSNVARAC